MRSLRNPLNLSQRPLITQILKRLHRLSVDVLICVICFLICGIIKKNFFRVLIIFLIVISVSLVKAMPQTSQESPLSQNVEYKAEDLPDPFQIEEKIVEEKIPEEIPTRPLPSLTVQGIVWGGVLPQAIINNKVIKVGDTIEEVRIVDINKDGITVIFDNRKYNLPSPAMVDFQNLAKKTKESENEN